MHEVHLHDVPTSRLASISLLCCPCFTLDAHLYLLPLNRETCLGADPNAVGVGLSRPPVSVLPPGDWAWKRNTLCEMVVCHVTIIISLILLFLV